MPSKHVTERNIERKGRGGKRLRQLLDEFKEQTRRGTGSHPPENSLWKRIWISRKAD